MITPSYGPASGPDHAPATDRDKRHSRRNDDADRDAERFRQLLAQPTPPLYTMASLTTQRLRSRRDIAHRAAKCRRHSRAP
ncbi:hypothetical protein [Edwardsiella ictaluri]|uniref:hypothetical protein n=1 Tax=Edwardsiella ictaluri TaxID=67780 RepID=UPI00259D0FDC|nr:hypothetical protein [Edwardsiella ictaluri]